MKKIFKYLLITLSIIVIGYVSYEFYSDYMTPEKKLQRKAEEALKNQMNDPSSYEFIDFREDIVKNIEQESKYEILKKICENNPDKCDDLKMFSKYNYFKISFRGKNKMGGLILDEAIVKAKKFDEKDPNSDYMFIELLNE